MIVGEIGAELPQVLGKISHADAILAAVRRIPVRPALDDQPKVLGLCIADRHRRDEDLVAARSRVVDECTEGAAARQFTGAEAELVERLDIGVLVQAQPGEDRRNRNPGLLGNRAGAQARGIVDRVDLLQTAQNRTWGAPVDGLIADAGEQGFAVQVEVAVDVGPQVGPEKRPRRLKPLSLRFLSGA